jgi:alginate O-acetyltransferase complex protein AlgI
MIFNSLPFLVFIIIVLPVFYLLKGNLRLFFVLIASYIFYGWWDWRFLGLLMFSTIMDYTLAKNIDKENNQLKRKWLLRISLIVNLGMLGFFKYFNFFIGSFNDIMTQIGLPSSSKALHIILPIGISFYTFQSLSYTLDVYYKKIQAEKSLLKFASFIALFPQLVAGPIVRAFDFLPQMEDNNRGPLKTDLLHGLDQIFTGYIKKVVIADSLAPVVDGAFASPVDFSSINLIVGIIFYSFQIYCDFSGYSDIATGLARMMGYRFPVNFNIPYISASFSEFWTRWHISLSSWLRDYLYIPLGGNRKGKFNTYRNLMVTMLLGGLWHGANWTFIFWGFLHGGYQVTQKFLEEGFKKLNLFPEKAFSKIAFKLTTIIVVYIGVCYAWIFFRAPDFATASLYIKGILAFDDMSINSLVNKFWIVKGVILIALLFIFDLISTKIEFMRLFDKKPILRPSFYALVIWAVSLLGTFSENGFIYFQF